MTTKDDVITFFRTDRTHQGALRLYLSLPSYSHGLARQFNLGPGAGRTDKLFYELGKAVGLHEREWRAMLSQTATAKTAMKAEKNAASSGEALAAIGRAFGADKNAAQGRALLDDFPFLANADTPAEIKALADDKLAAYFSMLTAHEALFRAVTPEQCSQAAAKAIENMRINQEIWDELVSYRDTGRPLYRHPSLHELEFRHWADSASMLELTKKRDSLAVQVSTSKDNPEKHAAALSRKEYVEKVIASRADDDK